jgi:uncharacterized protein YjbJ (UPF0337 family)
MATVTNYKVLDSDGQEVKTFTLELSKNEKSMTSVMKNELLGSTKTDVSNLEGNTQTFELLGKETKVTGKVEEGILYYKGKFKGQEVDLSIELDEGVPFVLNTRDSLTPFLYSTDSSKYIYVTSSASLSAYKFKVTKEKEVQLKIDDKTYDAIQLDFSMAGIASLFVGSDKLFFDKKDGKFLKRIDSRNKRVELIDADWD